MHYHLERDSSFYSIYDHYDFRSSSNDHDNRDWADYDSHCDCDGVCDAFFADFNNDNPFHDFHYAKRNDHFNSP